MRTLASHGAVPTVRTSAMSRPRSDCDAGPNSQNLRRIRCLWIKLEQFSQVSRKSLTPLAKITSEAVDKPVGRPYGGDSWENWDISGLPVMNFGQRRT